MIVKPANATRTPHCSGELADEAGIRQALFNVVTRKNRSMIGEIPDRQPVGAQNWSFTGSTEVGAS